MHEMSIALSIIDIAGDQLKKNQGSKVEQLDLDIGTLSGVQVDSLEFALEVAKKNTALNDAKVHIHIIQAKSECLNCNKEFDVEQIFDPCPVCHDYLVKLKQGKELKIKSLVIS
jgi:hydrogenase nickel incorporation protein HypA/HybF